MSRYRGGGTTLYLRNLSDRVRYEDIRKLFSKYGRLVDVTIPLDYYSRQPKGYCFIEFEDPRDAEKAQYHMVSSFETNGKLIDCNSCEGNS